MLVVSGIMYFDGVVCVGTQRLRLLEPADDPAELSLGAAFQEPQGEILFLVDRTRPPLRAEGTPALLSAP